MASIVHNMTAINAQRQLNINTQKKAKLTEKLSSGYQVNRAADDASGLAISEKMRKQIRGLEQASVNAQDGVSYVQVADGALAEVQEMLQRVNELSVKAANGTNSVEDRVAINQEIQQLKEEINRVFTTTKYNEHHIWRHPSGERQIEVDRIRIPLVQVDQKFVSSTVTNTNKAAFPESGYQLSADENGIKVSWRAYNGNTYESSLIDWKDDLVGDYTIDLKQHMDLTAHPEVQGIEMQYSFTVNEGATLQDAINIVNGTFIGNTENTPERVTEHPAENNNISFSANIDYDALLISGRDFENHTDSKYIEGINNYQNITSNPVTGNSGDPWEFTFTMPNIGTVKAEVDYVRYHGDYPASHQDSYGENIWWKWAYYTDGTPYKSTYYYTPTPPNGSLDSIGGSIDNAGQQALKNDQYGGWVTIYFDLVAQNGWTCEDKEPGRQNLGTLTMNVPISQTDTQASIQQKLSSLTGIDIDDGGWNSSMTAWSYARNSAQQSEKAVYQTVYENNDVINLRIHAGAESALDNKIELAYENLNIVDLGMKDTNVLTVRDAERAIDSVGTALHMVSAQRSLFGSYQNRLEHTIANLDNVVENTTAAESLIRDTDMAKTMVQFSIHNILDQAGHAMLAQANQSQQGILSLLGE